MSNCIRCNCKLVPKKNWYKSFEPKCYYVCIECAVKESLKYRHDNPQASRKYDKSIKGLCNTYRHGATRRNLVFNLTITEFAGIISQPCYYCGELQENFNGIDRLNNDKGYILNNCVPCCRMCNSMKHATTENQFINKCKQIMEKQRIMRIE